MPVAMAERLSRTYVAGRAGAEILGVDFEAFMRLVHAGKIGVKAVPGARSRYALADILAIADACLIPAQGQD